MARYPRLPVELFRFGTGERAELNTAVLCAFGAANDRLETWLTLGEVSVRLAPVEYYAPVADDELLRVLVALKDWHLIDRTQDHGAHYSTAEDFERNNWKSFHYRYDRLVCDHRRYSRLRLSTATVSTLQRPLRAPHRRPA